MNMLSQQHPTVSGCYLALAVNVMLTGPVWRKHHVLSLRRRKESIVFSGDALHALKSVCGECVHVLMFFWTLLSFVDYLRQARSRARVSSVVRETSGKTTSLPEDENSMIDSFSKRKKSRFFYVWMLNRSLTMKAADRSPDTRMGTGGHFLIASRGAQRRRWLVWSLCSPAT